MVAMYFGEVKLELIREVWVCKDIPALAYTAQTITDLALEEYSDSAGSREAYILQVVAKRLEPTAIQLPSETVATEERVI